jgi:hypothetical protein
MTVEVGVWALADKPPLKTVSAVRPSKKETRLEKIVFTVTPQKFPQKFTKANLNCLFSRKLYFPVVNLGSFRRFCYPPRKDYSLKVANIRRN